MQIRMMVLMTVCAMSLSGCTKRVPSAVSTAPPPVVDEAPPVPPPHLAEPEPVSAPAAAALTEDEIFACKARRSNAVRDYLVSLGVEASRLLVISKGEESLVCFDENEGCWQKNRRGHSVITAK